jgi:hypothetical protein
MYRSSATYSVDFAALSFGEQLLLQNFAAAAGSIHRSLGTLVRHDQLSSSN